MYPKAYIEYLVYFHGSRDYFECHEVLEEHWKSENPPQRKWVGLIQLAVALYHHRRGNLGGALRMMHSSLQILENEPASLLSLGIDRNQLLATMKDRKKEIESAADYAPFNIPLTNTQLIEHCRELCSKKGYTWGELTVEKDPFLIHKHRLRDRTDVIAERQRQKRKKNEGS
ncbi:DUF309 domain-containing protein [Anaerobacillus sp. MEB173]|uniref:DUF309 domain-containing protein n=1 Tax=Anaerobacillus sp. MEB173 TaxID=3383345 RepID=UPI003F912593